MRQAVEKVFADAAVRRAFDLLAANEAKIEADQVRITRVAAPPFGEAERAALFADELRQLDLRPVTDAIGNVIAPYDKFGPNPVVVAAHLDTVFPASTSLELRRRGRAIHLPGIADNGSGIVALLWVLRAARQAALRFERPVIAIGNVGEEGLGNLRGIRHLFKAPPWEGKPCDFVAIDVGGLQQITNQALGSRRFRIQMLGPGGHSWADFGKPNPLHAMSAVIHRFTSAGFARRAGTAFNFGLFHAGLSVNAIPSEAVAELDLRSITTPNLDEMESHFRNIVSEVCAAGSVDFRIESMGERPGGKTSPNTAIVEAVLEVTRRFGVEPQLDVGSTDANIPMSLGIPAIAVGAGGVSGGVHTTGEWFDASGRTAALQRLLALIAVLAGL